MSNLEGKGVLVVGGSAGIGRAVALRAAAAGAELVVTARRAELLDEVLTEAGGGTAIVADLCVDDDCTRIAEEAAAAVPRIDVVFIAAGMAPLAPLTDVGAEDWERTMRTNVIGVNRCIAALAPRLPGGALVAACSSESVGAPRWGLGAYAASKAALEESLRAWRVEHPSVRFSCVAVGATVPTDFGTNFDRDVLGAAFGKWAAQGVLQTDMMDTGELAATIVDTLAAVLPHPRVNLEHVLLRSPSPPPES